MSTHSQAFWKTVHISIRQPAIIPEKAPGLVQIPGRGGRLGTISVPALGRYRGVYGVGATLRHPPLPVVVARGADPERCSVVASPLAESDVQAQVVADGVEDVAVGV